MYTSSYFKIYIIIKPIKISQSLSMYSHYVHKFLQCHHTDLNLHHQIHKYRTGAHTYFWWQDPSQFGFLHWWLELIVWNTKLDLHPATCNCLVFLQFATRFFFCNFDFSNVNWMWGNVDQMNLNKRRCTLGLVEDKSLSVYLQMFDYLCEHKYLCPHNSLERWPSWFKFVCFLHMLRIFYALNFCMFSAHAGECNIKIVFDWGERNEM